jgi:hypothetical protein
MRVSKILAAILVLILTLLGGGAALAAGNAGARSGSSSETLEDSTARGEDKHAENIRLFGQQDPDEASYITVDGRVFTGDAPFPYQAPGTALLRADLSGANEVDNNGNPGVGDPDGTGTAQLTLTIDPPEVCATLTVQNIELPAAAAHIHQGAAGVNGPIVVNLPVPGADGTAEGCVTEAGATSELLAAIAANPSGYYVNVHNAPFPAGAVRGQLEQDPEAVIPMPGDRQVYRERLFALDDSDPENPQPSGEQLGAVVVECTQVTVGEAPEDTSWICSRVFTLEGRGDIAAAESFTFADPVEDTISITGGTGDFRDAGGQASFDVQFIEDGSFFNSIYQIKLLHLR